MSRVLLINPSSRRSVYLETNVAVGAPSYPSLTVASLAGALLPAHEVRVLDLDLPEARPGDVARAAREFAPDWVGVTANTPQLSDALGICAEAKEARPGIRTVVGGVHGTTEPAEVAAHQAVDLVALGEGEQTIAELAAGRPKTKIKGLAWMTRQGLRRTTGRGLLADLDALPLPAWSLFPVSRYANPHLIARHNPAAPLETSRGCRGKCNFCNKKTFGRRHRRKSTDRVLAEFHHAAAAGFNEVHVVDDSFTEDLDQAKAICRDLIERGPGLPWSLINGVRVDTVDAEFFLLARRAGLWQVGFGIESGSARVLERIGKETSLDQVRRAVHWAHDADVETFGFFILGLSGETPYSLEETLRFACSLPLDIAKFDFAIPYPGTRFRRELTQAGRLHERDWGEYICHGSETPLFTPEHVTWDQLQRAYKDGFRRFYLRPGYAWRRLKRDLRKGDLLRDLKAMLQAEW